MPQPARLSTFNTFAIHTVAIKDTLIPPSITKAQATAVYASEADLLNRHQGVWESRPHSSFSFQRFSFQNFSFYLTPSLSFIDHKASAALETAALEN